MWSPKYNLTNNIVRNLTEIAEEKVIIERAKIVPQNEVRLRRQALIRMTQSSTAIEGNQLGISDIAALIAHKKVDAPARDIYEIRNYLSAIKYVQLLVGKKQKITEHVLLHLHKLVTADTLPKHQAGHYRSTGVHIIKRRLGHPIEVIYTAADAAKVPGLVRELLFWITKTSIDKKIHPIIVAGIAHHEIAAIHPFSDSNGRTARALATLILWQRGYDFRQLFALEDFYNQDRPRYYDAINIGLTYDGRLKDSTKWLEYFVEGFAEEIRGVKARILSLARKKVGIGVQTKVILDPQQLRIIDFIDQVGRIAVTDVMEILSIPKRTAQYELLRLKKMRMIKQIGKGRATYYQLRS